MKKKYRVRDYDFKLIILVITISVIGILAVGSANEIYKSKQIMGLVLGIFLMIVLSFFDYTFFLKLYWLIYIVNLGLLLLVQILGSQAGGAQRWLSLFGIQFQPSETAKIFLILFFSQYIMVHREKLNTLKILGSMILLLLPPLLLIYMQPDLSTSIMIIVILVTIIFIGGLSYKIVISFFAIFIPLVIIFMSIILQPNQNLIKDYQQTRILAWLQPERYANAEGYQQANAIMAIGSGQLFGKGLNNNVIGSVKNGNFISAPQTDFIFAIIGEELGFVGGCIVILLLMAITIECIMVARRAKDLSGTLICSGIAILIGVQSFMNISVATGLLPNTGIPLPFISAGLTSLVSIFIGMGFVLNVRLQCIKKL
ncbi:MAG TPA: FtsW/RodA/SpoVE family cell cycle protein [Lachnospiraceae bacterium]|nr:FtsW/RodA/SpoVE family cell cycle protein [Lachnospiraceae bacterium]